MQNRAEAGKARAKLLTEEERSEAASLAPQARWDEKFRYLKASHEGPLSIGDVD